MAHRNQSGAGARIVRRSTGTASLLKETGRALLMGLAADRPTLYRTKDPAHSVTRRQQRYLAVRGASSMLEHPTFLSWSGRSGCPSSVSPTGDRGFESISLQQRVDYKPDFALRWCRGPRPSGLRNPEHGELFLSGLLDRARSRRPQLTGCHPLPLPGAAGGHQHQGEGAFGRDEGCGPG
jgi:hypothetical protein